MTGILPQRRSRSIESFVAERAKVLLPPPFGSEIPPRPLSISFAYGLADPECFPSPELAAAAAAVLSEDGADALNYGPCHAGLVEQVAERMRAKGIPATPERILIGYGSGQILGLLPSLLVDPGDVVLVEGPSFMGAVSRFLMGGARLITIPVEAEGINVEILESTLRDLARQGIRPRFLYTIPSFQNPTGVTLSLERRRRLLELASRYGVFIVEDDAYCDLRFRGEPLPPMAAMDPEGWVIYIGTFSKIVAPGLRLGWACADPALIERLGMFRMEGAAGPFLTRVLAHFCAAGHLDPHIQRLVARYQAKCDRMLQAMAREFPADVLAVPPDGGFFLWAKLPPDLPATNLQQACEEQQGVSFLPGSRCYPDGQGQDAMRLAFSLQSPERIEAGIAAIGQVMRAMRGQA